MPTITSFPNAVKKLIERSERPVITWFDVEIFARQLYRERMFDGEPLAIRNRFPSSSALVALKAALIDPESTQERSPGDQAWEDWVERRAVGTRDRLLIADKDFGRAVWRVAGLPDAPPEALCCLVDPWCYVSHLSAMQRWGLTNRNPRALHLTRPTSAIWRQRAKEEVHAARKNRDIGDEGPSPRERVAFPATLRNQPLHLFEPGYFGLSVAIPNTRARIATVGMTLRDMVQEPALCGGVSHVIDVWEEHAATYLDELIEVMDNPTLKTTKIAYVRAGYLLSEHLQIEDARIDAWSRFAERGGSRKLDPEKPFAPTFSERWMLSLNV